MTRTLIIPDVHNATERVEEVISEQGAGCDRIMLLGDYFDQFHDTPADAERVARWLMASTQDSRRIHLLGNHDLPYLAGEMTAGDIYVSRVVSRKILRRVSPILQGPRIFGKYMSPPVLTAGSLVMPGSTRRIFEVGPPSSYSVFAGKPTSERSAESSTRFSRPAAAAVLAISSAA